MAEVLTPRDFRRAAEQRFTTAEFLLERGFTLDALYLAGYSVECILKALIVHLTPEAEREQTLSTLRSGAKMHYPEHLQEQLKRLQRPMPLLLIKRFRRFEWSTALRYEAGRRPRSEVRGYLKLALSVIDWAKEEMK